MTTGVKTALFISVGVGVLWYAQTRKQEAFLQRVSESIKGAISGITGGLFIDPVAARQRASGEASDFFSSWS